MVGPLYDTTQARQRRSLCRACVVSPVFQTGSQHARGALRIRVHALRGVEYNKLYPPTMTSSSSFEMVDFTC